MELSVVIGETDVPIGQLLQMGRGTNITFDAGFETFSLVYANDQLVARGHVQVEGERIMIMITEVLSKRQR